MSIEGTTSNLFVGVKLIVDGWLDIQQMWFHRNAPFLLVDVECVFVVCAVKNHVSYTTKKQWLDGMSQTDQMLYLNVWKDRLEVKDV